jgi:neuropeptide Y receptor
MTTSTTAIYNASMWNTTDAEIPARHLIPIWLRLVYLVMYCVIFVVGIFGNSLVICVVARSKPMQTITNLFIVNLAISDVTMCLLAIPFTPMSYFLNDWIFGSVLCHLVPMTLAVSVYVSTLTSTVIAIDRYFVIVHPFKPRMTTNVCIIVIAFIWWVLLNTYIYCCMHVYV